MRKGANTSLSPRPSRASAIAIFLLAAVCFLTWVQTARFGFVWDDTYFVVANPSIRSISFLPRYFTDVSTMGTKVMGEDFAVFRPLRNISYLFDFSMVGLAPAWWHIHNVLLHLLNCILVFLVARRLIHTPAAAVVAAAVFAIHPVQTEVVAWVKCRDDLLMTTFVLLSIYLWLRWRGKPFHPLRLLTLAIVYLLACLSKAQAIIVPLLILAVEYWIPTPPVSARQKEDRNKHPTVFTITTVASMLSIMVIFLLWRHLFLGKTSQTSYIAGSFYATMLTMTRATTRYLTLLVWPHHLVADYTGMLPSQSLSDWRVWVCTTSILAVVTAVIAVRKRLPVVSFGMLWLAICMAPMSNVIPMMQYMAERFMYLPIAGFALTTGAIFSQFARKRQYTTVATAILILVAFTARTTTRVGTWKDALTLFDVTVRDTPATAMRPRRNLLSRLIETGDYKRGLPLARSLWSVWGNDMNTTRRLRAEHARNLGVTLLYSGETEEGKQFIRNAIEIDPAYGVAYIDMGVAAGKEDNHTAALKWFRKAVEADATDPEAHYNLGIALGKLNRETEAEVEFRIAVSLFPTASHSHKSLAAQLWSQGHIQEAVNIYDTAVLLWPQDQEIKYWQDKGRQILKQRS